MVYVCVWFSGQKKPVSATPKEMEWAQMACHRCLVYLGDLGNNIIDAILHLEKCTNCHLVHVYANSVALFVLI